MRVPGVKQGYQALKDWLYSYVDPQSKSAGALQEPKTTLFHFRKAVHHPVMQNGQKRIFKLL